MDKIRERKPLSDEEQRVLLTFLDQKEKEIELKSVLSDHWDDLEDRKDLELAKPDDLYYRIYHKIQSGNNSSVSKMRRIIIGFQRIAAVLLVPLLVMAGLYLVQISNQPQLTGNSIEIKSPEDSKLRFFLPDGTSGWLRAGSQLTFTESKEGPRDARLDGAAFFEVAKDPSKPFIVSTRDFKVKVLGTRFDVTCYSDAKHSEVFLEEGKVEMLDTQNKHQILLQPGQQYLFNREHKSFSVKEADANEKLAWIKGVLLLRNCPLSEAVQQMERFYQINIELGDKELESVPVYAKIENERLEEVLEYLKLILPIKYTIEDAQRQTDGSFIKRKVVINRIN